MEIKDLVLVAISFCTTNERKEPEEQNHFMLTNSPSKALGDILRKHRERHVGGLNIDGRIICLTADLSDIIKDIKMLPEGVKQQIIDEIEEKKDE